MPLGGAQALAQDVADLHLLGVDPWKILAVEAHRARPPSGGVGAVVAQGDGHLAAKRLGSVDHALQARLQDCGANAQAHLGQELNVPVGVLQQILHRLVSLGERRNLLAGGRADLHRHLDPHLLQDRLELRRRSAHRPDLFQGVWATRIQLEPLGQGLDELALSPLLSTQPAGQERCVGLQAGVDEHPDRQVDQPGLVGGGVRQQAPEQGIGEIHVLLVVDLHLRPLVGGELREAFPPGLDRLQVALEPQVILDRERGEAQGAGLLPTWERDVRVFGVERTGHRLGAAPPLWIQTEVLPAGAAEDEYVELAEVVPHHPRVSPVDGVEQCLCLIEPEGDDGLTVVDLGGTRLYLELRVVAVFNRG